VLAAFAWFILNAAARDMNKSDAAGNGLAMVYAVFFAIGLWAILAILMVFSAVKGEMPGAGAVCAFLLVPLSGASAVAAIDLLSNRFLPRWPMAVLILVPPLVAAYAAWAYFPGLRAAVPHTVASIVVWGLVFAVSIAPGFLMMNKEETAERGRIANARKLADYDEKERQQRRAEFQSLPRSSDLRVWLSWAEPGDDLRSAALQRARESSTRQAEAEELIRIGIIPAMRELPNLDLAPTPKLCENARAFLAYRAEILRRRGPDRPYDLFAEDVEPFLPAARWLIENGCDCRTELSDMDAAVRIYRMSTEREQALAKLVKLRESR
jgi:hypothetical protein